MAVTISISSFVRGARSSHDESELGVLEVSEHPESAIIVDARANWEAVKGGKNVTSPKL
jgi:hypothetical protein